MISIRFLTAFFCCCLFAGATSAQVSSTDSVEAIRFEQAMLANYHYDFPAADSILNQMQQVDAQSSKSLLLDLNIRWWKLLSGAPESEIYAGLDTIKAPKRKTRIKNRKGQPVNLEAQYEHMAISVFQSRFKFYRKQVYPAFRLVYDAVGDFKKTLGKEEENHWFRLSSGIYRYYIDRAGERYPYLFPLLRVMPAGNKYEGLGLLKRGFQEDNPLLKAECAYFLVKIYLEEEKDFEQAQQYAAFLRTTYPKNLFFRFLECKALINMGNTELANQRITELKEMERLQEHLNEDQRLRYSTLSTEALNNVN